jgi:hypothetical protein
MKERYLPFRRFWTTDAGLTGVLLSLIFLLITTYLLGKYPATKILSLLFMSLLFISGVLSVYYRPFEKLVFGGLALAAVSCIWLDYFFPEFGLRTWRVLAGGLTMVYLIILLLRQVFSEGSITYHRICGSLAVYLLLAWIWSEVYLFILRLDPGAIRLPPELSASFERLQASTLYFSVITLTTLGYGDIVPVSDSARLTVMFESLVGQLYPAVMLAWLVSMEIVDRTQRS